MKRKHDPEELRAYFQMLANLNRRTLPPSVKAVKTSMPPVPPPPADKR